MRDTTCSVPDAESRGRECAAPTNPSGISNDVTSVSGAFKEAWAAAADGTKRDRLDVLPPGTPLRDYLVDQLVITASHLAESHIFREKPDLPYCTNCCMSGLNGRPIAHLPSCAVGRVFRAIEELKGAPSLRQWKGWDVEHVGSLPARIQPIATAPAKDRSLYPSHDQLCAMFEIQPTQPAPTWTPYAVRRTVVDVLVEGERRAGFGGALECGACGFGLAFQPDEHTVPPRRADGGCPKCGATELA